MRKGMRGFLVAAAALVATAATTGCGAEPELETLQANSPQVAATVSWPGYAPMALIRFRDGDGRPCHALGMLTGAGPRTLDAPGLPLAQALIRGQHCLAAGGDVTLEARLAAGGQLQVLGGIVGSRVRQLRLGGETLRPRPGGSVLTLLPASRPLGARLVVDLRGGGHRTLPLAAVLQDV